MQIGEFTLPLTLVYEVRKSWRISIGKSTVFLRLPYQWALIKNNESYYKEALLWLHDIAHSKPQSIQHLLPKIIEWKPWYLRVQEETYTVIIHPSAKGMLKGQLFKQELILTVPADLKTFDPAVSLKINQLISGLLGKKYKEFLQTKVNDLNHLHFGFSIEDIKLKYTTSRWGSCSKRNNLNFSTRLLLTPEPVLDYVIIHELAHLKEFNHSQQFWNLVAKADPIFEKKELWLKKNGHQCHFFPGKQHV